jgi:LAO/AO transport system kinase
VVLDAMGFDVILIETVGVGQAEVEIVEAAHVSVVVVVPGLGDEVQAIKAGVLEIADILCVNKSDREGADRTVMDLQMMLSLRSSAADKPPILQTVATTCEGVPELHVELMQRLDRHDLQTWQERLERRARRQLENLLREQVTRAAIERLGPRFDEMIAQVASRKTDPYSIVEEIVEAG